MLERVADKWTLLVIEELGSGGEMRVHPEVPPRVDHRLTSLGESLGEAVCGIWLWVEAHREDVERARRTYDQETTVRKLSSTA